MKNVNDLLKGYEETPSADVWKRLDSRLDKEMPQVGDVYKLHRKKAWKWAAAILTTVIVGGVLLLGVLLHNRGNQNVIAENNVEEPETETVEEVTVVADPMETVETDVVPVVTGTERAEQPRDEEYKEVEKQKVQSPKHTEASVPNTNVRQIVLPPNSTLARQLAADPVLKNLSDDSVDWSLPVHLSIPNLFTPNNDGVNDLFVIEGLENYSSPKLAVRDKNNRVVYQSDAYKNNWGGENCPEGVYSYEFTFKYNGIENQATGKVRIIRS